MVAQRFRWMLCLWSFHSHHWLCFVLLGFPLWDSLPLPLLPCLTCKISERLPLSLIHHLPAFWLKSSCDPMVWTMWTTPFTTYLCGPTLSRWILLPCKLPWIATFPPSDFVESVWLVLQIHIPLLISVSKALWTCQASAALRPCNCLPSFLMSTLEGMHTRCSSICHLACCFFTFPLVLSKLRHLSINLGAQGLSGNISQSYNASNLPTHQLLGRLSFLSPLGTIVCLLPPSQNLS